MRAGLLLGGILLVLAAAGTGALARAGGATGHARCWGAASRDPRHPCHNRALDTTVSPTPDDAVLVPNGSCSAPSTVGVIDICTFGVAPGHATAQVALLGDSHASHWRPAVAQLARARHWHAYSLMGCPFTAARIADAPAAKADLCQKWTGQVTDWLTAHPKITTVFISDKADRPFTSSSADGFRAAFASLPDSVRRVYVIRDVPRTRPGEQDCIDAAIAAHRNAGTRCAQPRGAALPPDPQVAAMPALGSRGRLLDLSPFFCDRRRCFPVVGGVLVRRDLQHLTRAYALSLGPYLKRAVNDAR